MQIEFEILNWSEMQDRPDKTNYAWFKFHTSLWGRWWFSRLTHSGKVLYFYLLSERNMNKSSVVCLEVDQIEHDTGIKAHEIYEILQSLPDQYVRWKIPDSPGLAGLSRAKDGLERKKEEKEEKERSKNKNGSANASPCIEELL